jgi:hypothetical protein
MLPHRMTRPARSGFFVSDRRGLKAHFLNPNCGTPEGRPDTNHFIPMHF